MRWGIALLRPTPIRRTILIAVALLAAYLFAGLRSSKLDAPWRIDEGQRIAESYFWRLFASGDISNPDWFRTIADRSHPPMNKYFFGAAISLFGQSVPRNLELARAYDAGVDAATMPARFAPDYLPLRRPARIAVFIINCVMAIVLFAILLRAYGIAAAVLSQVILLRHFLFALLLFHARSDVLQAFAVFMTVVPLFTYTHVRQRWLQWTLVALAGVCAAVAFQTRLNGGVAAVMSAAFLLAYQPRSRQTVAALAVLGVSFAVASLAINPFYWATRAGVVGAPLPFRIVERLLMQVDDLQALLRGVQPVWHLTTPIARTSFAASILFSGKAGILLLAGLAAAAIALAMKKTAPAERATVCWAFAGAIVTALWIPLRWEPYLLIVLPPLVLAASIGFAVAAREIAARAGG